MAYQRIPKMLHELIMQLTLGFRGTNRKLLNNSLCCRSSHKRCSVKKLLLEISQQNSQENAFVRVSGTGIFSGAGILR